MARQNLNRILLGVCAAAWLAALGAGVAAGVALSELGRTESAAATGGDTPWLLYAVIGVSAVVIVGAVPLLLRARRSAVDEPAPVILPRDRRATGVSEPATERIRAVGTLAQPAQRRLSADHPVAAGDELWLQCALVLGIAMGLALVAIGAATYLMAVDTDTVVWVLYGVAAVVTLAMPVATWWYLRRLRGLLDPAV
jgi:hypothetical protein